jgi:ABC-type transport system involved in multi-copper enzyme maturation permease subunit
MHPVVIAEVQQSRQHIAKALVLLLVICLGLRLTLGSRGVLLALLVVLPNWAMGLGLGTFAEEITKGQFRFLYSLPVSPRSIWFVKFVSGLVSALLFAAFVCAVLFIAPDESLHGALDSLRILNLTLPSLLALCGALALYCFSSGMLAISMCSSTRSASIIIVVIMYLPLGAAWMSSVTTDRIPAMPILMATFLVPAALLLAGSYVLFAMRNPFLERRWRARAVGSAFILATAGLLVGGAAITSTIAEASAQPHFDQVFSMSLSPDRTMIFLVTMEGASHTRGFIVSLDGTVLHRLGRNVVMWDSPALTWLTAPDARQVLFRRVLRTEREPDDLAQAQSEWLLYDLDTRATRVLNDPHGADNEVYYQYVCWSTDGRSLLGYRVDRRPSGTVSAFRLNIATGQLDEAPIGEGESLHVYPHSGSLLNVNDSTEDYKAAPVVRLYDLERRAFLTIKLPDRTIDAVAATNGFGVAVRRLVDATSVGYEVVQVSTGDNPPQILLDRARLPRGTLAQAVDHSVGYVSVRLLYGSEWVLCRVADQAPDATDFTIGYWLINSACGTLIPLPDQTEFDVVFVDAFTDRMLLRMEVPEADDSGTPTKRFAGSKRTVVYSAIRLGDGRIEELHRDVRQPFYNFELLDRDRLIYLHSGEDESGPNASFKQELRAWNMITGADQPLISTAIPTP